MKVRSGLERKNEDLMKRNFKVLREDKEKRKTESDRCIADACKDGAGYLYNRNREKVWIGFGKFKTGGS